MVVAPYGGTFTIDRDTGAALFYTYTIKADGWRSYKTQFAGNNQIGSQNLTYQYFYTND